MKTLTEDQAITSPVRAEAVAPSFRSTARLTLPGRLARLLHVATEENAPGESPDGTLDDVLGAVQSIFGVGHGFLATLDDDGRRLRMRVSSGLFADGRDRRFEPGSSLVGRVWNDGRPVLIDDYVAWGGRGIDLVAHGARAVALVPVRSGDTVVGVLGLAHDVADQPFDADDLDVLDAAARVVALVLARDVEAERLRARRIERETIERIEARARSHERKILDLLPVGVWVKDRDNRIVFANEAAARSLGQPRDALVNRYLWEVDPRHAARAFRRDLDVFENGAAVHGEIEERVDPTGERRWWSVDRSVLCDEDGDVEGLVVVTRDVTEEHLDRGRIESSRRAEARARRIRHHAVANIAQNVQGPLRRVREGLAATEASAAQRDDLETAMQWIDDLIDFERVEAGNLPVESRPLAVGDIAEDVAELVSRAAAARGNELAVHVDRVIPGGLGGDGVRIRQILVQLVAQAVRAARDGEILLAVRSVLTSATHCEVRFEVHASAWALPDHQIEALFGPYLHGDAALGDDADPGAFGLALAHRLVEMLGGSVGTDVHDDGNVGFSCTLPFERVEASPSGESIIVPPSGLRVLVSAASPTLAVVVDRQLRDFGAFVDRRPTLEGAREAIDQARTDGWSHDVVLVDTALGHDAVEAWIRQLDEPLRERVTPLVPFGTPRTAIGGSTPALSKPVRRRRLAEVLVARAEEEISSSAISGATIESFEDSPRILLVHEEVSDRRLVASSLRAAGCVVVEVDAAALAGEPLVGSFDLALVSDGSERTGRSPAVEAVRRLDAPFGHTPVLVLAARMGAIEQDVALATGADAGLRAPREAGAWLQLVREWTTPAPRTVVPGRTAD